MDEDTGEEKTYQIVGETEADIENGLLNIRSPLARALIGKDEGDSVEVKTPGGTRSYEILSHPLRLIREARMKPAMPDRSRKTRTGPGPLSAAATAERPRASRLLAAVLSADLGRR